MIICKPNCYDEIFTCCLNDGNPNIINPLDLDLRCIKCGEKIKDGDIVFFNEQEGYLLYCHKCGVEIIKKQKKYLNEMLHYISAIKGGLNGK